MKSILAFSLFLLAYTTNGQALREPLSVRYAGLGAYSINFSDVFSGTSNQATLARLKTASLAGYGEKRFLLNELNGYSSIVALPTSSGTFGLQGDYFGSAAFNESQIGLLYARKITSQIDLGVKFNYHTLRVPGYGSASAINFEGGAIFHLTEKLHTGIHIYNPTSSRLGKASNEKLSSAYKFGIGYEVSKTVFVSTEIVKQEDKQVGINAGLQYNIHEKLFMRGGIATNNNNSYLGVGLSLPFGRIDINSAYHPQLGFSPGMLLIINFKKSE